MKTLRQYVRFDRIAWPIAFGMGAAVLAYWFDQVLGIGLFVVSAALATIGATLSWQSFAGYEKALVDADGLYPEDRNAVRRSVRQDRKKLGYALVLLIGAAALGTIVGTGLKDQAFASPEQRLLLAFLGGSAAGISYLTTRTIWTLFFSLDDFRIEIRDAARVEQARLESLSSIRDDAAEMLSLQTNPRFDWKVSETPH